MAKKQKTKSVEAKLRDAKKSGSYMIAIWSRADDKMHLQRVAESFPIGDIPMALEMLKNDLHWMTIKTPADPPNKTTG